MYKHFGISIIVIWGFVVFGCWKTEETDSDTPPDPPGYSWRLHENVEAMVYVSWPQDTAGIVTVEYELDDEWIPTPRFDAPNGTTERLIVGIPFDTDAKWRVVQEDGSHVEGPLITTGPVPDGLPLPSATIKKEDQWLPDGKYLLSSINGDTGSWTSGKFWTYIIDRNGRFVWANRTPLENWTLYAQVAISGDRIIYDEATRWSDFDDGEDSRVHFTYLDKPIETVKTPGLHHAFVQLPDGTLAWGSKYHDGIEAIVERMPEESKETIIWTVEDDWSAVKNPIESNCLFYDEIRDTYLYSFYSNDSVVEVERKTGTSLWWAGDTKDSYSFTPKQSQFDWQHGVSYTDRGTLLVSTRVVIDGDKSTYLREYTLDHKNKTLTEIWHHDSTVHAKYNGDARRLNNGNTLHIVGSTGHIIEVDESGTVVWRVEYPKSRLLGRGEFISDLYALVSPDERESP